MPYIKKILLLPSIFLMILSCSNDDGSGGSDASAAAHGTYTLSALNVSPAQDVNEDGTASTNLVEEMDCLSGTLIINADNTWNLNVIRINVTGITGGNFFIACGDADNNNGTWSFANNQVSLHGAPEMATYSLSNGMLTRQIGEDLPGFQSAVFTKQ